jgi:hypothetical protein
MQGVILAGTDKTDASGLATLNNGATYTVGANAVFTKEDDAFAILGGTMMSNACWTAVLGRPDAVATKLVTIAGTIGNPSGCI